jgi:hypothetical protein
MLVHDANTLLFVYCKTIIEKKINITKNQYDELFQSVESKTFTSVHCLMCPKELTVFLRPTEAEDRGSKKISRCEKEGDAAIMDF